MVERFAVNFEVMFGALTVTGSIIAMGKLQGFVRGTPFTFKGQNAFNISFFGAICLLFIALLFIPENQPLFLLMVGLSLIFGILLVLPIGSADMPVVISLLNSYAGLACVAVGFALHNNVLIIGGALDGASGFILSIIMCKAMNRSMFSVLFGAFGQQPSGAASGAAPTTSSGGVREIQSSHAAALFANAKKVIIVPGYGMAVAQAQHAVRELADLLKERGTEVLYAIHPVAGRMPGHMNVLLAEASVPYNELIDMEEINPQFAQADVALVVGANDVTNPAARENSSSPIFGMPILDVDKAKQVIVIKRSMKPGFAGIDNDLYLKENTRMFFGDARQAVATLTEAVKQSDGTLPVETTTHGLPLGVQEVSIEGAVKLFKGAKRVIFVPGYGMAAAQAQHGVREFADLLKENHVEVCYAIHPVAGRMPGHMNVLLAEANVPYNELLDMEEVNPLFPQADVAFVVGANDVTNPAARANKNSPIYGMPILDVDKAKSVIVVKRSMKPGFAGIDNDLYTTPNTTMLFGDARKVMQQIVDHYQIAAPNP
jgi:NAD(P) transhydrogenase subunit beta